uniref:DUF7950 domain-containing protein n=1 Tax=Cajanus cajan TaxID=3821 RepID=A0A151U435_CAJCA|nr:hypothetical protein KK1_006731 [Cajanus cajan]
MDGADVWRVAASDAPSRDNKIFNTIMLRFRPIAPKPVAGASSAALGADEAGRSSHVSVLGKRPKRKYVRIRRNSGYVRRNGKSNGNDNDNDKSSAEGEGDVAVVTLQLMPEKEAPEEDSLAGDSWYQVTAAKVAESWVTVESVTGTCMGEGGGGLGCTDAERVKVLEADTCPGFVCDESFRVRWVNDAYKRMVASEDIVVWLTLKDSASAAWLRYSHPAFTCGVRLQYTWRNEKCTKMVPCDVWRLDCGGFAWRLDVKAALSLGL